MLPHEGNLVAHNGALDVVDCHACGYAHLVPLPSPTEVDAYYTGDQFYKTHSPTGWFEREYAEHKAGLWHPYYAWEAKQFPRGCMITDIGCGCGWFGLWSALGHVVIGVEPSEGARAFGARYGARRLYATLDESKRELRPWWDNSARARLVLEHLVDPAAFLDKCQEFVGKDGLLELVVPSELNPLQTRMRKAHGDWFVQQPHINYFTGKSLTRLLDKQGWQVVKMGATFPMELFWHLGKQYIGNDRLGHELHLRRLNLESTIGLSIFNVYAQLYKWFGWGRELIVYARRK